MQEDKMDADRLENLVETLKTLTENFAKHVKFFENEITGDILLEYRKKFDNFQMAVRTCLDKNTEAHMEIGAQVVNDFYNAGMDMKAERLDHLKDLWKSIEKPQIDREYDET